jgi:predicted metallo-beta-lactamase superfamily hydrolase
MNESWRAIKEFAAKAEVLVITHYHFDHFDPTEPHVFNGKTLLIKHPKENINTSQRGRARELIKNFRTLPRRVEFADNGEFRFGGTMLRFSPAVPHGPGTKVGWVVEVSIREGESCFLHTSDIQGASLPQQAAFIRAESPDTLYLDWPRSFARKVQIRCISTALLPTRSGRSSAPAIFARRSGTSAILSKRRGCRPSSSTIIC